MNRLLCELALFTIGGMLATASMAASQDDAQVANVTVYEQELDGQTAYSYTLQNSGNNVIIGFSVGFDHATGMSELSGEYPLRMISPDGWQASVIVLEESPYYEVRWEPIPGVDGLEPDASESGFIIMMRNPSPPLLDSHWTAMLAGPPTHASSLLEVREDPPGEADVLPPSIAVEVDPSMIWPPDNRMVTVTAGVTVYDDQDPVPVVLLEAVTCNECDPDADIQGAETGTADFQFSVRAARAGQARSGRIYTVLYSATDAAGNSSEAAATITVPHDQRRR
jgi:hypothetical protein